MMEEQGPWARWRPQFIAHRGGAACAVENTRSAFLNAVGCGVDGVECDLQLSADGELFLFHDDTMDLLGHSNERLWDWRAEELKQCSYQPSRERGISKREPLLDYEEFLALMSAHPRVDLYIEFKIPPKPPSDYRERMLSALSRVDHLIVRNQCYWMSFDEQFLGMWGLKHPEAMIIPLLEGDDSIEKLSLFRAPAAIGHEIEPWSEIHEMEIARRGTDHLCFTIWSDTSAQWAIEKRIKHWMCDDPLKSMMYWKRWSESLDTSA